MDVQMISRAHDSIDVIFYPENEKQGGINMGFKIKYIAQICDDDSDEIIEQQEIKIKGLSFPKTFQEFGIRHNEQIELIKKMLKISF
jgi:hypothetical protein